MHVSSLSYMPLSASVSSVLSCLMAPIYAFAARYQHVLTQPRYAGFACLTEGKESTWHRICCGAGSGAMRGAEKKKGDEIREEEDVAANSRPFREEDEPVCVFRKRLLPFRCVN